MLLRANFRIWGLAATKPFQNGNPKAFGDVKTEARIAGPTFKDIKTLFFVDRVKIAHDFPFRL